MKFSVLRTKKKKDEKNLKKLLKNLTSVNPNVTFTPKKTNSSHICSGLNLDNLTSLFLPHDVVFTQNPIQTAKEYGFVLISYKNKVYHIFGKGFEGSYLIV